MKVILVHDWLTGMRGGERCLEVFCELFPDAPLYTLIHEKGSVSEIIENREIHTSPIQNIAPLKRNYRHLLPVLPSLMKNFKINEADLVISSSHCVAKMISKPLNAQHWCYLYTPMRYVWDLFDDYFGPGKTSLPVRLAAKCVAPWLRRQDLLSNQGVDHFVAISQYISERAERNYGRTSEVIYPPVEIERFQQAPENELGDWDLVVSALVPYKRIDLAIEASNQLKRSLKIIGNGPEEARLKKLAGPQVEFLGAQNDDVVAHHMARCHSFIFPGEEDFGITPVEVQAAGRPVVAYGKGGALETIVSREGHETGVLFNRQDVSALVEALKRVDQISWNPEILKENSLKFSRERFITNVKTSLNKFTEGKIFNKPQSLE